jgi:hypothetical protein
MMRQVQHEIQDKEPYQSPQLEQYQWTNITGGSIGINTLTVLEPFEFLDLGNALGGGQ